MKKILQMIRIRDFESAIMGMIQRLMNGDCFTSKFAAVQLFPCVYSNVTSASQQELMSMYNTISQDETPQVRKQAAIVLNDMIKLIPQVSETELLKIFSRFY